LVYYALQLPRDVWLDLGDIIHFSPGDFNCPWFVDVTFGKPAPPDSMF